MCIDIEQCLLNDKRYTEIYLNPFCINEKGYIFKLLNTTTFFWEDVQGT